VNEGAVPRVRSRRADLVLLSALLLAWLLPWSLLTGAAVVSGAHPVTSPLDFINPVRLVTLYRADGNAIVWWHLVGALAPTHTWLFVGFIVAALVAIVLVVGGGLIAWAGGIPGVGATRLLVPGRLQRTHAGRPGETCARCRSGAPVQAPWCWGGAAPTSSPHSPRHRCW
jgi:hypothetical protein